MKSIKVLEDAKLTLPNNTFKKTNSTFLRWNTKANGLGKNYKDKYTFKEFNVEANLNLYAVWKGLSGTGGGSGSGTSD